MRRETTPHDVARVTELIEVFALVAADTRGQDHRFPGGGGNLVPLELADDVQCPVDAVQTRRRGDVLPTAEEPREFGRAYRLHLASQRPECQTVDASEDAAIAPLFGNATEAATQNLAFGLEPNQRRADRLRFDGKACGEFVDRCRSARLEPAAQDLADRILTPLR